MATAAAVVQNKKKEEEQVRRRTRRRKKEEEGRHRRIHEATEGAGAAVAVVAARWCRSSGRCSRGIVVCSGSSVAVSAAVGR